MLVEAQKRTKMIVFLLKFEKNLFLIVNGFAF